MADVLNSSVYEIARETPLDFVAELSQKVGNKVYLKREDMQVTFAANIRGAYHKLRTLSTEESSHGIVALGSCRSCEAVATAAKALGIDAAVVVPSGISQQDITKLQKLSATVVLGGPTFEESFAVAKQIREDQTRVLIHPFDDLDYIAGAGTIGAEILRQRAAGPLDAVFCVAGGGGILGGVAAFIKQVRPSVRVIGVETEGATPLSASLQTGMRVTLRSADISHFTDESLPSIGRQGFALCREFVDDTISVSTDDICAAIRDSFDNTRVLLDPSGALGVAGLKKWVQKTRTLGQTLVAINTSAGTEFNKLRFISERADDTEYFVAVTVPERPGSFHRLYNTIYPRNVTEFSYRATPSHVAKEDAIMSMDGVPASEAFIYLSFHVDSADDAEAVFEQLRQVGFRVHDLSDNELAKTHARHLVGGRAAIPHERLVRFQFPEKPGALKKFLDFLAQGIHFDYHRVEPWNVSLFHYRSHGDDVGSVLAGIQVLPEFEEHFSNFLTGLGYSYVDETDNFVYQHFLR